MAGRVGRGATPGWAIAFVNESTGAPLLAGLLRLLAWERTSPLPPQLLQAVRYGGWKTRGRSKAPALT
jgi:hypothetical protein